MQFDVQFQKKHKVDLSEIPVEQDLFYRARLVELDSQTSTHLLELFYLSSKTTVQKLKNALDLTDDELQNFFEKIASLEILSFDKEAVVIDKDVKKKIECHLEKFSEEFIPGIEYFQTLLRQVPISILPTWYPLPRTCDSIFLSLKERIFQTPSQYLRHLQEVESEEYPVQILVQSLLASPRHSLSLQEVEELSGFKGGELQKFCLFLEFNFIAILTYKSSGEGWSSYLELPAELSAYLKKQSHPLPFTSVIQNTVVPDRGIPLAFAFDLSQVIRFVKMHPVRVTKEGIRYNFSSPVFSKLVETLSLSVAYLETILSRGIELQLLEIDQGFVTLHPQAEPWLLYSIEKQALTLFKALWIQKNPNLKQAEKGLASIITNGWVLADEVIKNISYGKPHLVRGRDGFDYEIQDEVRLNYENLETLFESGLIEWGTYEKKRCLQLTDLGKQIAR